MNFSEFNSSSQLPFYMEIPENPLANNYDIMNPPSFAQDFCKSNSEDKSNISERTSIVSSNCNILPTEIHDPMEVFFTYVNNEQHNLFNSSNRCLSTDSPANNAPVTSCEESAAGQIPMEDIQMSFDCSPFSFIEEKDLPVLNDKDIVLDDCSFDEPPLIGEHSDPVMAPNFPITSQFFNFPNEDILIKKEVPELGSDFYLPSGRWSNENKESEYCLSKSCPLPNSITNKVSYSNFLQEWASKYSASDASYNKSSLMHSSNLLETQQIPINSPTLIPSSVHSISSIQMSSSAPNDSVLPFTDGSYQLLLKEGEIGRKLCNSSSERSLSGFSVLSLSNDENSNYDDSDHEGNDDDDIFVSSDGEPLHYEKHNCSMVSSSWPLSYDWKLSSGHRRNRYFWQYNMQTKGSAAAKLLFASEVNDPHILSDISDPVFAGECWKEGLKHSGKARRGDGNDLTPNPSKLFAIGMELGKLNKLFSGMSPVSDLQDDHPLSRKEKNKLASRVCRLKKKAQHEANKIKLYGLQQEHKKMMHIINEAKGIVFAKLQNQSKESSCVEQLEGVISSCNPNQVAGLTSEFVNHILDKVAEGEKNGGLEKKFTGI